MKNKVLISFLILVLVLPFFSFAEVPEIVEGSDVIILKESGDILNPGDSVFYTIYDKDMNNIINFRDKYSFVTELNLPLVVSELNFDSGTPKFSVKLVDNCRPGELNYSGKIIIENLQTKEKVNLSINGTVENNIKSIDGDIKISENIGGNIYDFSSSNISNRIIFGEDADVQISDNESGIKCLTYNIKPSKEIMNKYNLNTSNSAFINFLGVPEFENEISSDFMIPISGENIKLYEIKNNTTNELVEVNDYSIKSSNNGNNITFNSRKLNKTYVITSEPLETIGSNNGTVENPNEESQNEEDTIGNESDDDVKNPKTGDESNFLFILIVLLSLVLLLVIISRILNRITI